MRRFLEYAGFAICLIGIAGLAEAYGSHKALCISLVMIIVGGIMTATGEAINDVEKARRSDNSRRNSNILDRLYFLR